MDALRVKTQIEKYLAGKYLNPVDDFCIYQWLERCNYHGWVGLGLNLLKFINIESFEKGYKDRIQFLSVDLHKKPGDKNSRAETLEVLRTGHRKRRRIGERTPNRAFRSVIVDVLKARGGSARVRDVADLVEQRMRASFSNADLEMGLGGSVVWYNSMCWERQKMVIDGILIDDSPHGVWELADHHSD